ncbi:hypothetical protein DUI87_03815 [Hirundo rustica rustica]|uniref:Integrase catalytic domain-containing protein n=1 Tax=Hirundo rustica rustica TaxID=333673 RepID=A0A3M0L837_HIRRU|nr:hypothetical protein DUI87_03815 [Hirundo rustica rustica]
MHEKYTPTVLMPEPINLPRLHRPQDMLRKEPSNSKIKQQKGGETEHSLNVTVSDHDISKPILTTNSSYKPYRLRLTEGLLLKNKDWKFVSVNIDEQGTWQRIEGFELQEDKVQRMLPWRYLGLEIGEKTSRVIKHLIQAFSFMGIPRELKTDNGLAYRSKEFCSFLQQWGVGHKTGIPHSPTGQAVVERTHRKIKRVLNQQQQVLKTETPMIRLASSH